MLKIVPFSRGFLCGNGNHFINTCICTYCCRGLLLPKIVVDDFGGSRSDPGMLGAGIYFAASARYVHTYST